jgi:filamentous hemagglutinin
LERTQTGGGAKGGIAVAEEAGNSAGKAPSGFASAEEFGKFGSDIQNGLTRAGYSDVQPILQGSAVTGKSYSTGVAFDVGRVSDFDVALASPSLMQKAQELGIGLRSGGTRTGPLTAENLRQLGLSDMAQQMTKKYGREVNFMIYNSAETAAARAPSIPVPKR